MIKLLNGERDLIAVHHKAAGTSDRLSISLLIDARRMYREQARADRDGKITLRCQMKTALSSVPDPDGAIV